MKRLIATLNDGLTANIAADKIETQDNFFIAKDENKVRKGEQKKMRDNLSTMLRAAAKEWREKNKVVATGATRYDAALEEAADAIEELQKRVPKVPHGRLGDMDAIARKIRRFGDYVEFTKDEIAGWFENGDFETIIPAEEGE